MREHWLIPEAPFESYEAYCAATGGSAVSLARKKTPSAVLRLVQHSHLRGRGGAGFPTGTKWASLASHPCRTKSVVCNAAEGEPGTFKDRYLLRFNPYAVVEGLLVAAHVLSTNDIYIALKASFTTQIERLERAIVEMEEAGVIGDAKIQIYAGPEAYLFGEEKALLSAIEGNGPLPREAHQPPYEYGLFATPGSPNPALVNNAETFAHVPSIIRHGPTSFLDIGTRDTPGTVLFTVSGDVARPGVYECEAGITIRALLEEHAGGPLPGRTFAAVLPGVSSGPIPADRFDTPADFGSLQLIGSGLGSAGFMVLDDRRSMASVARAAVRFLYVESCNQCSACKQGLRVASTALGGLFEHGGDETRLERARHAARRAPQGNRCFLPVQGSTLMTRFAEAYRGDFLAAGRDVAPYELQKIVDYDAASSTFQLDERQTHKQPDWSYTDVEPPEPADTGPAEVAHADTVVALPADVVRQLQKIADDEHTDVEHVLERALREWMASPPE